jgi:uncharacterized protein
VIVVADTSVILNLCCVQEQDLLPALFQHVIITSAVRVEFERAAIVYPRFAGLTLPTWISERQPRVISDQLLRTPDLDTGEITAIALALELQADAVLIDETNGRRVARQFGVTPIGVVGILVTARQRGFLRALGPVFAKLEHKANFWLSVEIRAESLRAVGESL